jgi:phage anti-repressor protein
MQMNELVNTATQTPIEVALGIDENGMTTARALFSFLGMSRNNYSRWFRNNLIDNEFAEENVDYFPFLTNEECGGQASQDAKLTASFAKKLSMMSKSEKGERARQYFVKVEDGMKELAIRFQNMSPELRAVLVVDRRVTKIEEKTDGLRQEFEDFKNDMPILGVEEGKITTAIHRKGVECLGGKQSNAYNNKSLRATLYSDMHRQLKREFGVSTYKAIKRNQTDLAVRIIEAYKPPLVIAERIESENAQENLFVG